MQESRSRSAPESDMGYALAAETASDDSGGFNPGAMFDTFMAGEPAPSSSPVAMTPPPPPPPPRPTPSPEDTGPEKVDSKVDATKEDPSKAPKRLVIYTGSLGMLVPQPENAAAALLQQVEELGGYLQARNGTTITLRVPAAQFFAVVESVKKSGQITNEDISATDVTKRVFDLQLRLQTATESRKRLLKLLEQATKMEDVLQIENQVRRLTDEIELMKGELRNLGDQVAFSTLTVAFRGNAPPPRPFQQRTRSRFEWVNATGIERVLYDF